eukprot:TRINITY_DN9378_c0_g1_i1.p1 TRINITY_DN9378_c0_g1~~TRINITY_DN9378_c0_g1_i1.p1  ORF type:complete len:363 (-),score=57.25 TRINITY_DN9378_c0_g1_i1:209-1297(-)
MILLVVFLLRFSLSLGAKANASRPLPSGTLCAVQRYYENNNYFLMKVDPFRPPVQPINDTAPWVCPACLYLENTAALYSSNHTLYLLFQAAADNATLVMFPDPSFSASPPVAPTWQSVWLGGVCSWCLRVPVSLTRDGMGFLTIYRGAGDPPGVQWRLHYHSFVTGRTVRSEPLTGALGPVWQDYQPPFTLAPHPTLTDAVVVMQLDHSLSFAILYVLSIPSGALLCQHALNAPGLFSASSDLATLRGGLYLYAPDAGLVLFPLPEKPVNSTVTAQVFPSTPTLVDQSMVLATETRNLYADEERGLLFVLAVPLATPSRPPPYKYHGIFAYNTTGATVVADHWDFVTDDAHWPLGPATWYVP